MNTKAPPEPTGGAFLSAQNVLTHGDAAIINRRDRQHPPTPASPDEQAVKPDRMWAERPAPDLSVQTGASYVGPAL